MEMVTSSDTTSMKFVVKVKGQVRTQPLPRSLAEAAVANLPANERTLAEIVAVTAEGRELLLG
jgi:hypothetical protein